MKLMKTKLLALRLTMSLIAIRVTRATEPLLQRQWYAWGPGGAIASWLNVVVPETCLNTSGAQGKAE